MKRKISASLMGEPWGEDALDLLGPIPLIVRCAGGNHRVVLESGVVSLMNHDDDAIVREAEHRRGGFQGCFDVKAALEFQWSTQDLRLISGHVRVLGSDLGFPPSMVLTAGPEQSRAHAALVSRSFPRSVRSLIGLKVLLESPARPDPELEIYVRRASSPGALKIVKASRTGEGSFAFGWANDAVSVFAAQLGPSWDRSVGAVLGGVMAGNFVLFPGPPPNKLNLFETVYWHRTRGGYYLRPRWVRAGERGLSGWESQPVERSRAHGVFA